MSQDMDRLYGLKGLVGIVDGTDVILHQRPCVDPETYWTRKHRYALNTQLVFHPTDGRIIYYILGWPGSMHDNNVFSRGNIFTNPNLYFTNGQFLMGDSAYALSTRMLTPYKGRAALTEQNTEFNRRISTVRVAVEHGIGVLKNRWGSLKHVRLQYKDRQTNDLERINEWILACIILHNVLISFKDVWEYDDAEDLDGDAHFAINAVPLQSAAEFRSSIKEVVLNHIYFN